MRLLKAAGFSTAEWLVMTSKDDLISVALEAARAGEAGAWLDMRKAGRARPAAAARLSGLRHEFPGRARFA